MLLNEASSFYSFKISRLLGKRKLNLRTKKSLFKSVKNILVLNVAFSKSVLVLIKKMSVLVFKVLIITSMMGTSMIKRVQKVGGLLKEVRMCRSFSSSSTIVISSLIG